MEMYRNGNYVAFYVNEPFSESNLNAYATRDFLYYNMLRMWKAEDRNFPFIDSHVKNYNVRDSSDWEKTLKPRLHGRLKDSKNIILFLSSITKDSRALHEEIDYGINTCGLPVIVIYPECKSISEIIYDMGKIRLKVENLWNKLPVFKNSMNKVATIHVPMDKNIITKVLKDSRFMVQKMTASGVYFK